MRKVHDFLTVGAATRTAARRKCLALGLPDEHFERLSVEYGGRREAMLDHAAGSPGFQRCAAGARRLLRDVRHILLRSAHRCREFAEDLVKRVGVGGCAGI